MYICDYYTNDEKRSCQAIQIVLFPSLPLPILKNYGICVRKLGHKVSYRDSNLSSLYFPFSVCNIHIYTWCTHDRLSWIGLSGLFIR